MPEPRILLRPPAESDRAAYVALRRASRAHLEPWEPLPPPGADPYGDDGFDRELRVADTETEQRRLIVRREDGVLLGRITLNAIERGPFQNARLGYWTGAPHAGRGYMTDAVGAMVRLAFEDLGLHRVCANIMPANAASRKVLERNGFVREGYSRNYLQIRGVWEDHERWAVTRELWDPRPILSPRAP